MFLFCSNIGLCNMFLILELRVRSWVSMIA